MQTNTRDLGFVNFNGQEMNFINYNGALVYEAWKKLLASGIPPLTLLKCKQANLVDYKVYGDSKQQSKNLWVNGDIVGTGQTTFTDCILEPNTYTISCNVSSADTKANTCQIVATDTNNEIVLNIQMERIENSQKTFTLSKPTSKVIFRASNGYVSGSTVEFSFTNIQIEKGNVATEYVPPIPTYDNPIEIESVGDKPKNFADLSKAVPSSTTQHVRFNYDNLTGTLEYTSTPTQYDYLMLYLERDVGVKFEIGKTYYYSADVTITGKTNEEQTVVAFGIAYTGMSIKQYYKYADEKFKASGSFTYTGTEENVRLVIHANYGSKDPAWVKFENIYVSEVNEFEPYGYEIPIKVSGKNLFKTTNYERGSLNVSDGSVNKNHVMSFIETTDFIPLKAGTYTFSHKTGANLRYIALYNKNKEITGNFWTGRANPYKFTINEDCLIRVDVERDGNVNIENFDTFFTYYEIQLEKGSNVTPYEPYCEPFETSIYLNEPLRKIGETSDYIDFENQKVIRNIATTRLDGTMVWSTYGTNEKYYGYMRDLDVVSKTVSGIKCLCNRSKGLRGYGNVWYGRELGCYAGLMSSSATRTHFCITSEKPTVAEFRAEINEKPLEIIYIARTVKEEDIDLPNILLNKGTNIIEIDTTITPSNMEVTYLGKK